MWSNRATPSNELPPGDGTLFGRLRRAGYGTAHVGKGHYYSWPLVRHLEEREVYLRALDFDHVHETTGPHIARTIGSRLTDHWEAAGLFEQVLDALARGCPVLDLHAAGGEASSTTPAPPAAP
jgi:arylsulfatase A-like enzyme